MKLLPDQNLSPRLADRLSDLFPGSAHVVNLALDCATDEDVWEYARQNGFAVVTKDEDYNQLSVVRGHPPKVVWLLVGNCTTGDIETLIRSHAADLSSFDADPNVGTLALGGPV